jgi:hypothetical protein
LKSVAYNGDIFTKILTSQIKKPKGKAIQKVDAFLAKVVLPVEGNRIKERGRVEKTVDYKLVMNKYINLNISSILHRKKLFKDNLNKLIYDLNFRPSHESDYSFSKKNKFP